MEYLSSIFFGKPRCEPTIMAKNRTWLVTGAASGLGKALTEAILVSGQCVVATCRRPSDLDDLRKEYPSSQLLVQRLDVTSSKEIDEAFKATQDHFGRLDVVVNSAGFSVLGEIEGMTEEDGRRQFDVLFWGPANISKKAAGFFREVNPPGVGGLVFNLTAGGGYSATPGFSYFCSAKFALEGFTQTFNKEMLPQWNIKACIIEPGAFATSNRSTAITIRPQHPAYTDPMSPTSLVRTYLHKIPVPGDPAKAAKVMLELSLEKDLPLRFPMGSDSLLGVQTQARETDVEVRKRAALSRASDK
ncbi:hypothetical protein ONZ45_g15879 [Pleurotus djamor]|nr:hypothetical protein ONZ45_g15879 [Pleurotus djamor]